MNMTPADIPDSIEGLRALVLLQHAEAVEHKLALASRDGEISQLHEYIRLLKSQRFGPRSERSVPDQLGLFNEAETLCHGEESDAEDAKENSIEVPAHTRCKGGGRRPFPDFIPREEIFYDLPEDQKLCTNDPVHILTRIGEERL